MTPKDQVFAEIVADLRAKGQVKIRGFGTFKVKSVAARTARNPQTGEVIQVPPRQRVSFIPGKALKEAF